MILGTVINPSRIVPVAASVAAFGSHFLGFKMLLGSIREKIFNCLGKYVDKGKKLVVKAKELKGKGDKYKK